MKIEQKEKFIVITAEEEMFVTNWDKENILDFWGSEKLYCPLNTNTSTYYEITKEEYEKYETLQMEEHNKERSIENEENN